LIFSFQYVVHLTN